LAGEPNQILVSFLVPHLSASGPISYPIAIGVMALLLLLAMAWRVLR
jgi:hypothetical protein